MVRPTRRIALILGGLAAVGAFTNDTYLPALPEVAADFAVAPVSVQLTLTASLLGLATGQLVVGPLSDLWGRRRPLLLGVGGYVVVSLGCALAPSLAVLTGLRFLQGVAGAAAIVLSRAVVRDSYSGTAAARVFSQLLLVFAIAPVVAPLLGGAILSAGHWRGVFVALALIGAGLLAAVWFRLGESLPVARRTAGGLRGIPGTVGQVLANRGFLAYAVPCGLAYAGMFAYIAGSPFVVQDEYGASPLAYSVIFAVNAGGLGVASVLNSRLVGRVPPGRLLVRGLAGHAAGAGSLLGVVLLPGDVGLAWLLPPMFVLIASLGFIVPNATALALSQVSGSAGTAASVLGALQFGLGAVTAPVVGLGAGPMAVRFGAVIAGAAAAAVLTYRFAGHLTRRTTYDTT